MSQPEIPSNNGSQIQQSEKKETTVTYNKDHVLPEIFPRSFFNMKTVKINVFKLTAPFPIPLTYDQLITKFSSNYMEGYVIKDKEGVYSTNKDIVKKQSGLFKEIINQFAKGLLKGGAIGLSLPIRIFEPRTMLERITDWFVFAPIILKKAGTCNDKIEAFKQVIAFSMSALFRSSQQLKPFNPMLGETYQAHWEDGSEIYLEHTSHIPPISNFYIKDASGAYSISGYFDMGVEGMLKSMLTNSMTLVPKGRVRVYLPATKQVIDYQFPKITIGGVIFGQRYVVFSGHMKFEDRENGLKSVVKMNKSSRDSKGKRVHDFYGEIFKFDYSQVQNEPFYEEVRPKYPYPKDKSKVVSKITGSWLEQISFDDQCYWNIKEGQAPQIYPSKEVIPSDCRYREDKGWLKLSWDNKEYEKLYEEYAQNWKLALEAQQRYERGLRAAEKEKEKHEEAKKK